MPSCPIGPSCLGCAKCDPEYHAKRAAKRALQLRTSKENTMSFTPRIAESGRPCCAEWENGYARGEPLPPRNPCPKCRAHFAAQNLNLLQEHNTMTDLSKFTPPNPYAIELAEIRAAQATPMSRFEERFAAERTADFAQQHREFAEFRAAQQPAPRTTDAELATFRAPDPYSAALKILRAKEGR